MVKKSWDKTNDIACAWAYLFSFPEMSAEEVLISLKDEETAYDWMSGKLNKIFPILKDFAIISRFDANQMGGKNTLVEIFRNDVAEIDNCIVSYIKEKKDIDTVTFDLDILSYIPDGNNGWKQHYIEKGAVLTFWFRLNTGTEFSFGEIPFASFDLYTEIYNPDPIYSEGDNTLVANKNRRLLEKFMKDLETELCLEVEEKSLLYDPFEEEI